MGCTRGEYPLGKVYLARAIRRVAIIVLYEDVLDEDFNMEKGGGGGFN